MNIASQDFRNKYEKLYIQLRRYLWPYDVLKQIADLEIDIYAAFIDLDKIAADCTKLYSSIKEVCKEDQLVADAYNAVVDLVNTEDPTVYCRLPKVTEVRPQNMKQLKMEVWRRIQ